MTAWTFWRPDAACACLIALMTPQCARVVYRGHVAQSLAPLYLGRVASVVYETRNRPPAAVAKVTERLCQVFEEQKPYLVDRWR